MKAKAEHDLAFTLSATAVDTVSRVIRGATAAKADVQAEGKFVLLDKNGQRTTNAALAVKKLPVFTDERFLETLMAAAQDAGGKVKVRSDHDDSLAARAGYAINFARVDDRVVVDLHFNKSYRDLATVMEVAATSPELIGCSIDFIPSFEIHGDHALMRVEELLAVDVVDAGAITPAGMFMKRTVDKPTEEENQTQSTMAKNDEKPAPTVDDCMKAMSALADTVAGLSASLAKLSAPVADKDKDGMSAIKELREQLNAEKSAREAFIAEQKEERIKFAKENRLMGLSAERQETLVAVAEETEKVRLAAEKAKGAKTYLELVTEKAESLKCSRSDAHVKVQKENPDAYTAHLKSKGAVK